MNVNITATELLNWYDLNFRQMPWRTPPGDRKQGFMPDPYQIWLSEIMLQQTTVKTVEAYFKKFLLKWPTITDLASAEDSEVMAAWAGLGYYARARNLLKSARILVTDYQGVFPKNIEELQKLPGIGPYTSAAIAAISFDLSATVMDGNVERVISRIHAIKKPLPESKPLLFQKAKILTPTDRAGDYAQAIMDLGATICTPRKPKCDSCPWTHGCLGRAKGIAQKLPIKIPKKQKVSRYGVVYVVKREDGAWLLERRVNKGLLGGMLGWPGSEWSEVPYEKPPLDANWTTSHSIVHHIFTHFHLYLTVKIATASQKQQPKIGKFIGNNKFNKSDLPTVMRKVFEVAYTELKNTPPL